MKVIITGASGMVGKGILLECLESPLVNEVLTLNRKRLGIQHPKLKEVLLNDFSEPSSVKGLFADCDACFYSLGISSAGLNEEQYSHITYSMTKAIAETCYEQNPDMVFCFVSGLGSDSSETSRIMWARVKGKAENVILKMGFKDAYAFRPGTIIPEKGVKSRTRVYNFFYNLSRPFFPLMRKSENITTTERIGLAMIHLVNHPYSKKHLVNKDINTIAASV